MKSVSPPADSRQSEQGAARTRLLAGEGVLLACLSPSWLALAWLVSKAQWFWKHNPELQFGWVMVPLCAYLIWEAWEVRPEPIFRWSLGGSALALLGCV